MENEEQYTERISKEFGEHIKEFKKRTQMENTSMVRLLCEQIEQISNDIDMKHIN